jgi:hypothetical protein
MKKMVATSSIKYDTDEMCTNDCKTQEIPLTVRLGEFFLSEPVPQITQMNYL